MAKTNIVWEKVSLGESKAPLCDLTFRPSGQIVFGVQTLSALHYPRFVHLFVSPANSLIALRAADTVDGDAIQLTATALVEGEPRTISGKKVYRWLCGLMGQQEGDVLIKLTGMPNSEGMVVFDLKQAGMVPRRARHTPPKT